MSVDQETLDAFQALFRGRTDVWGSVKGKSIKGTVAEENYRAHLEGKTSLGVYPLMDNGKVYFAAVDIDEKNFDKALSVRNELTRQSINAYIAKSKGKGFHVYMFFDSAVEARAIRRVLHHCLETLKVNAEIFPKQGLLDEVTPYGNYINLPCFGNTRLFLSTKQTEVPVGVAVTKIAYSIEEHVYRVLKTLPAEEPKLEPKKVKGSRRKHPPCIEAVLRGVGQGCRDEAAFALARHYLDQYYLPEEVLSLLMVWDANNTPPIADPKVLETKVRSATKGYAFGCNSIQGNAGLQGFCIGDDKCEWLKDINKERKKNGQILQTSFYETETHIYEEVVQNSKGRFLAWDKAKQTYEYISALEMPDLSIVPIYSAVMTEEAIYLPTEAEEYGTTEQLIGEIKEYIAHYCDLPPVFFEFAVWYIMMTWVYDKLTTVSYLRFQGDTGTGKSRCLDVVGKLCYKPLCLSGAITPAPIYRLIRIFRGTLILDEADFRDSSEKSEVVTILNCGFEKGRPIVRCSKDDPDDIQILPCFGPKVLATRRTFEDVALESRCLTHVMQETDRDDIPPILGDKAAEGGMRLRNKLLLWRLRNRERIRSSDVENIDLGPIEPRLKQTSLPYALPFKDLPDVMERFRAFIQGVNADLISERSEKKEGHIISALFRLALVEGKNNVTPGLIANKVKEDTGIELTSQGVAGYLKTLKVEREKRRIMGKQGRFVVWEPRLMRTLLRRYIADTDKEDFEVLFVVDMDI